MWYSWIFLSSCASLRSKKYYDLNLYHVERSLFVFRAYRAAPTRRLFLLTLLVAVYAVVLPFCYYTAGEPRKAAMVHAQQLADEKWALEGRPPTDEAEEEEQNNEYINIAGSNENSTNPFGSVGAYVGRDDDSEEATAALYNESPKQEGGGFLSGWFGPSKQQKQAQKEFEKFQKQFKELNVDGNIPLPPQYLPSAWACVALFVTVMLHALFHLMCHWMVTFKASMLFQSTKTIDAESVVLVTPPANRGKAALVPVKKSVATGMYHMEFQRQNYQYTPSARLGEQASKYPNGVFTLSSSPVNLPLESYTSSVGMCICIYVNMYSIQTERTNYN